MRVLHLCLSNWFIDNVAYKENELIKPKEDFEILLFRPGYEILIHEFNK